MSSLEHTPFAARRTGRVVYRTAGHRQGPITRLISPGDLGEVLKPFVFLDLFQGPGDRRVPMPVHPHSGLATHTTVLTGSALYADSTGKAGVLEAGDLEWMRAGGGVWHGGAGLAGDALSGFQLWVAMPASLELAPALSHYVHRAQVPGDARVRLLLGSYESQTSAMQATADMAYLHVRLRDGDRWQYHPAATHDVAFAAVSSGALIVESTRLSRELAVLDVADGPIEFVAEGDTELVVGSAARHPHPLVLGMYSVHTNEHTLARGEAGIEQVAAAMALEPGGLVTADLVRRLGGSPEARRLQAG